MEKTHWIIMGGLTVSVLGVGSYFLFFSEKEKTGSKSTWVFGNPKSKNRKMDSDEGLQVTQKEQGASISIPNWDNPYDMAYTEEVKVWISPRQIYQLAPKAAEKLATQLKEAYGGAWYANDDEAAVKTVFAKMLKDKVQVSDLSKAFWNKYQKDMWEYLASFLSSSEMEEYVHQPVKELPNYRAVQ